ncbi:MAG: cell envelope biogenesis protein OmpA, partial [Bacteroidota bacterium]
MRFSYDINGYPEQPDLNPQDSFNNTAMKKRITTLILLLTIGVYAQNDREEDISSYLYSSETNSSFATTTFSNDLMAETETRKIKSKVFRNLKAEDDGYYMVSGVYSDKQNIKKSVKKLTKKGFSAGALPDASTGLQYVYLEKYGTIDEAMAAGKSGLNGRYADEIWILIAERGNQQAPMNEMVSVDEVTYDMLNAANEERKIAKGKEKPNQSKLIQKADHYFDKMWYAEAAELYEEALKKDKRNQSFEIIQKAGDSHYFNTNMERAYYWYNVLYENYQADMSSDNIFKYAHSLKGTGKYKRAKRLMRLYNKKSANEDVGEGETSSKNEMVLDKILSREENFDIKNLSINTEYSDFSPMFHKQDEVVYASAKDSSFFHTRRYKWNDQPYLDLYVAKINEEDQDVKNAIKFSKKINTKYHEASVTFSPDNTTMYFTRNNYGKKLKRDKNGINHLKIYTSNKVDGEWTEAREVSFNSDTYSTGHPALSPDGKQLYFVSDMPGSIGATDIFVVDVLENGSFSEPRNLGPEINTEQKEMFPFINNKKLYFSSNGHVGLGGLDVYEVAFDEEEGFQEVKNVGKPINSNKDDFSYIVDEETQKGYFASNRQGGKGDDDIYSFKRLIVEEAKENLNAISGVVTELVTGEVMPEALVVLLDENNMKLKEVVAG